MQGENQLYAGSPCKLQYIVYKCNVQKSKLSLIGAMKGTDHLQSVKQINKIIRTEKIGILGNYRVVSDSFCLETEELHSCCGGVGKEQVACR